jgi:hypothetical protein
MKTKLLRLSGALLLLNAILAGAHAATLTVTSLADSGPGSLRGALAIAADGDTIDATGISGTIRLTSGELPVDKNVTILGPGLGSLTVTETNSNADAFHVGPGKTVTISHLTITLSRFGINNDHAALAVNDCAITENSLGIFSSGVNSNATLGVTNCMITGNLGGGIRTLSTTLALNNSTITGNDFSDGIFNSGGMATIVDCTISGNQGDFGGGIYNNGGMVTIANCTISGNRGNFGGGGIYNDGSGGNSTVIVVNSFIHGNLARNQYGASSGGGIYNDGSGGSATLSVRNSTINANLVMPVNSFTYGDARGGGVFNYASNGIASVTISDSVINSNSVVIAAGFNLKAIGGGIFNGGSGTLTLVNSSISDNSATNSPGSGGLIAAGGGGVCNDGSAGGNATMTVSDCAINGNSANATSISSRGTGAGILNDGSSGRATLLVVNSTVISNSANAVSIYFAIGGGIYNNTSFAGSGGSATLAFTNCTISWNSATNGLGGGIFNDGTLTVANSLLNTNRAEAGGGGIDNPGTLTIAGSTLSGNSGTNGVGGGIFNYGTVAIANSILSGNVGLYGGGVDNGGTFTMVNSTLSGNLGLYSAGGIFNYYGTLTLANSTLSGNRAEHGGGGIFNSATLELGSTILTDGAGGTLTNNSGTVTSLGYNLCSDDGGGLLSQPTDLLNTDPMLGPLQDNGGPTFTHALLPGSPAIDKGTNFSGAAYDQRGVGFARTVDNLCLSNAPGDGTDIGAFEVQISCHRPPVARCRNVTVSADATCTANASVDNGSSDPDGDSITMVQSPPGPYPLGTNVVTLTVTDSRGASNSCIALVIVRDTTPPQLTCPVNITQDATGPDGAVVSFSPLATDDCSGPPAVTSVPSSGSTFPIGTTTVVCTATDLAGNSASCQFQVTVLGPREMLERLLALVSAKAARPQPLRATLEAALASIDRGNSTSAINQLQAFQHKVQAQVAPSDPVLAQTLIQAAGRIIALLQP